MSTSTNGCGVSMSAHEGSTYARVAGREGWEQVRMPMNKGLTSIHERSWCLPWICRSVPCLFVGGHEHSCSKGTQEWTSARARVAGWEGIRGTGTCYYKG